MGFLMFSGGIEVEHYFKIRLSVWNTFAEMWKIWEESLKAFNFPKARVT